MKKLTVRNYLGYAAGDLANNLAFSLQALFLLIYYTNVVGLNPAAIATMFLVVRAWDAFADLAAGRLVDITRSRWGKFRPYLLFASLPLLLSSIALFSVPNFDSTTAKYIYAYITYALLGFLYSDEHPVRLPGYCDDAGPRGALSPWDLAVGGSDLRHLHPRAGNRSANQPVQVAA
jgi:Na+/melibiose symporter-like transporter